MQGEEKGGQALNAQFCRVSFAQVEGGGGEKTDEPAPCAVDLMRLERVLERAPPGLQMVEATKAKKTATR